MVQTRSKAKAEEPPPPPPPPEEEHLGRGCRERRPTIFLEQEYMQEGLLDTGPKRRGGRDWESAPLVFKSRYPPREAGMRAMLALQETMAVENEDDDDEDEDDTTATNSTYYGDSNSNSRAFAPALAKRARREGSGRYDAPYDRKQKKQRGPSSSASEDGEGEERRPPPRGQPPPASHAAATTTPRSSGGHGPTARGRPPPRRNGRDEGSIDSAISLESLREESIERLAKADEKASEADRRHALHHCGDEGAEDSDASEDVELSPKELRHASRQAKEGTEKNYNINYYMADAIGSPHDREARRRRIDRRYAYLFEQEEDEKEKGNEGLGGGGGAGGGGDASAGALGDISPLEVDRHICFDSVGGLPSHIVTLREMVLLPLLYPDLLAALRVRPPRGVLFVGPPGTGKTLMARALANEGTRCAGGQRRVTFFMRKGADLLSKWVGESERQLRLLFEEARRQAPSIIFFDEIDGLVPTRHAKTEQTQGALVATLLALLDGLDDRGQVIVIGATNRPDTIDAALRRPGRFDRELLFPLPDVAARTHILRILTRGQPLPAGLLEDLVRLTEGYSGADLQALCTEAALHHLRTALPQLYTTSERLVIPPAYLPAPLPEGSEDTNNNNNNNNNNNTDNNNNSSNNQSSNCTAPLLLRKEDYYTAARRIRASLRRAAAAATNHYLPEHLELLLRGTREGLVAQLREGWAPLEAALRHETRDCADVLSAVRALGAFQVPLPPQPLFLFVESAPGAAPDMAHHMCVSLCKRLPTFQMGTVHLPHVQVHFPAASELQAAGPEGGGLQDLERGGHLFHVVQAIQRSGPCVVYLGGVDAWLQQQPDGRPAPEQQRAWRYYLQLLADTEVLFLIPSASPAARAFVLGWGEGAAGAPSSSASSSPSAGPAGLRRLTPPGAPKSRGPPVGPLAAAAFAFTVPPQPLPEDVAHFLAHLYRTCYLALRGPLTAATVMGRTAEEAGGREGGGAGFAVDASPLPALAPTPAEERRRYREALQLWRRVEYRRLQLRHVLLSWLTQYVNSGRYKLLLHGDLDLTPDHGALWQEWQQHTKRHGGKVGLEDIVERVEQERYTCLSQYHEDIDRLVRNVRSFFHTRSPADMKYRLKALELKENTILGLYKINRGVVRFCEVHKDLQEPAPPPDMAGGEAQGGVDARKGRGPVEEALHFSQRDPPAAPRKRPRTYYGQRRRRRRPRPAVAAPAPEETREVKEEDGEEEGEEQLLGKDSADAGTTATAAALVSSPASLPFASSFAAGGGHTADGPCGRVQALFQQAAFTFQDLDKLYTRFMTRLDAEVRRREAAHQPLAASPPPPQPGKEPQEPPQEPEKGMGVEELERVVSAFFVQTMETCVAEVQAQ